MISYNVIAGDTFTKVMIRVTGVGAGSVLGSRNFAIAVATLFITLPLSLYR